MKMSDINCFYFRISSWTDLILEGRCNTVNGVKNQVTKVIQFKNQLLSTCCVPDAMETKTNNISSLKDLTI